MTRFFCNLKALNKKITPSRCILPPSQGGDKLFLQTMTRFFCNLKALNKKNSPPPRCILPPTQGGVKNCGVFEKYSRKNYSPQNILLPPMVKFQGGEAHVPQRHYIHSSQVPYAPLRGSSCSPSTPHSVLTCSSLELGTLLCEEIGRRL